MTPLELDIISYLLVRKEGSVQGAARSIGTTENKIFDAVFRINNQFDSNVIECQKDNMFLSDNHIEKMYRLLREKHLFQLSVNLRRLLLLILLLINKQSNSLIEIANYLKVSKNTALADLNFIREKLDKKQCRLNYSRKNGYMVEGEELLLRKLLVEAIIDVSEIPSGKYVLFDNNLLDQKEISFLEKRLRKVEERLSILFTDEMVEVLPYTTYALIRRIQNVGSTYLFTENMRDIVETKEYEIIISAFWNYDFLQEDDLIYLALLVLSSNLVDSESSFYNTEALDQTISQFILNIENRLAIQFSDKERLKKTLWQHIRPALFRSELGISIINPLAKQFIEEYRSIYLLVKKEMSIFEKFITIPFSEDEIAFISMIVLSNIMEFSKSKEEKPFRAVVVCKSGTSISKMLMGVIKELFPFMSIEGAYSERQYESSIVQADFVFSTVPLQSNQEVLLVSPYMNQKDRKELKEQVEKLIEQNTVKKARYILSFLGDYLKQEKEEEAIDTLSQFLENGDSSTPEISWQKEDPLRSTVQISIIQEQWEWEECIEHAFKEIIKRGNIESRYIKTCKKMFEKSYETMLIGPQVLLPHVGYEDGVIEMDVQINLLSKPIISPNKEEYRIIIALAPGAHNEHVDWLMRLNEAFVFEQLDKDLLSAKSEEEAFKSVERKTIHELQ